jgi:Sulfotransferase family
VTLRSVLLDTPDLYARATGRLLRRGGISPRRLLEHRDERLVFVVGSPRSGTTFLGGAIGSLPGFLDAGELNPLKAAVPELARLSSDEAAARVRRTFEVVRRLGLVGERRIVEHTPECAFLVAALRAAFPSALIIHLVRDGRDVVRSLLDRGWLAGDSAGRDDAKLALGAHARFWVEQGREHEFESAGEARRAAWVWRRYVEAARTSDQAHELRYERLVTEPREVAVELAARLAVPPDEMQRTLEGADSSSIGLFLERLTAEQLADVQAEAGGLLRELGYSA